MANEISIDLNLEDRALLTSHMDWGGGYSLHGETKNIKWCIRMPIETLDKLLDRGNKQLALDKQIKDFKRMAEAEEAATT